jgi:hypothetical protein
MEPIWRTRSTTSTVMPSRFSPARNPRTVCDCQPVAAMIWAMAREGRDPIAERARARRAAEDAAEAEQRTFATAVDRFVAAHETAWRNPKHRAQWRSTIGLALEACGARHVATITADDVLAVLRPLWARTPETGSRVRGRIERVLAWAKAAGWRAGANPAAWHDALAADGAALPMRPGVPPAGTLGVTLDRWREQCRNRALADGDADAHRQAFHRARTALTAKGAVATAAHGGTVYAWPTRRDGTA